jgi:RES domain-containing protein
MFPIPSVVVPAELNFLLNPEHADFSKLEIGKPKPVE